MRILGRLTWATERVVGLTGDQVLLPNELLAMGYLDGMKISVRQRRGNVTIWMMTC